MGEKGGGSVEAGKVRNKGDKLNKGVTPETREKGAIEIEMGCRINWYTER